MRSTRVARRSLHGAAIAESGPVGIVAGIDLGRASAGIAMNARLVERGNLGAAHRKERKGLEETGRQTGLARLDPGDIAVIETDMIVAAERFRRLLCYRHDLRGSQAF